MTWPAGPTALLPEVGPLPALEQFMHNLVHCIKPGGMAADCAAAILAETATILRDFNDVDTDPFASDKEFEDDETIVDDH